MSVMEDAMAVITDGDVSHRSGLRGECIFTYGPWVELCVQNLHRMHQVPLWAGRGLCWISWTPHFLFFFVLHLRIDVEAWDLPWGKIYSEAKDDNQVQRAHPSALNLNGTHCTNSYDNTIWGGNYRVVYMRSCTTWFFFLKPKCDENHQPLLMSLTARRWDTYNDADTPAVTQAKDRNKAVWSSSFMLDTVCSVLDFSLVKWAAS